VTASVGVAALEFADDTPELILKRADQALYCAKRDGRNRVVARRGLAHRTRAPANHFNQIRRRSVFAKADPILEVSPERLILRLYNS
jgi:predicted signal transduction protein with EAL and GGDEF domain